MVSSIYDPLGLVSPFLLEGRRIMQMLCHTHSAWDDPADEGEVGEVKVSLEHT